jgi:hypothetical protein
MLPAGKEVSVEGDFRPEHFVAQARLFYESRRFLPVCDGIVKKRPHFRYLFAVVGALSRVRLGNVVLLSLVILFYRPLRVPRPGPLFQYGLSANNERMFRQLNGAAGRDEWNTSVNGRRAPLSLRLGTLLGGTQIWRMAGSLTAAPGCHPFAHTQLVLAGAAYVFFSRHGLSGVHLVCIANDHSPMSMALQSVAKHLGIRRCYLQHAPVAEYFPPLDYELSVLFDRNSLSTYERAATQRGSRNGGRVVFLPPYTSDCAAVELRKAPYRVGLCLSYLFDHTAVRDLIETLEARPEVSDVLLRRHPRCKADMTGLRSVRTQERQDPSLAEFLAGCDILLVPNSGVALECLHLGKPTFYVAGTDYIEDDYYRFVANGIVPRFDPTILTDREAILSPFDDRWRQRFVCYDETVTTPLADLRRAAGEAFLRLAQ